MPHEHLARCQTEKAINAFEDLNRKIMATLRAFQGSTTEEDVFEVDLYFRTITEAIAPTKESRAQAAESEAKQALAASGVSEFLRSQNARQDAEKEVAAEAILKHVKATPGFDL